MSATSKTPEDSLIDKLRKAVALIDKDWAQLPGDSASEIGMNVLQQIGVEAKINGTSGRMTELELVTMKLAKETEGRSDETRTKVRRAFLSAIRTLEGTKPKGLDENKFMENFNTLIAEKRTEKALDLLIDRLPNFHHARMNRKEKLKHLTFAGRRLQHAGLGKYGIQKLKGKARIASTVALEHGVPSKNLFVDFGCGAHEPLGLATYFYGNGFSRSIGNDFLPIRSPEYAALSMYDILSYMRNFPEEFLFLDQTVEAFRDRVARFNLHALFEGDFEGGTKALGGDVEFLSCDIRDSELEKDSVSYLVSFAVFEHVMEIDKVCSYLFDITEPGGLQHHFIDLADHRAYRHDGAFNKFSFLTEEEAAPNLNRLRVSEHIAAFKAVGFEVLASRNTREEIPAETRANFRQKWSEMSDEDQEATTLTVTLRKP